MSSKMGSIDEGIFNLTEHAAAASSSRDTRSVYNRTVNHELSGVGSENETAEESEGFDALYIKRLLNLYKERGIPLKLAYE